MTTTNWHLPDVNENELTPNELQTLTEIVNSFDQHLGFRHPLWEWLATGNYNLRALQRFAELYYGHVRQFRKYLAGAITVSTVEPLQAALAEILAEEYGRRYDTVIGGCGPSHPDLFRAFMRSLGVDPHDWDDVSPIAGIEHYRQVHYDMFQGGEEAEMMGAIIFGMESTTPHRHARVANGLEIFAHRNRMDIDHRFFSRHVEIDPLHGQSLLMPIHDWLDDADKVTRLINGATRSFDARLVFLDDLQNEINRTQ